MAEDPLGKLVVPIGAACLMLFGAAFGRWPYGFYQLLRLVVCAASFYGVLLYSETSKTRMWVLITAAVLFNPFAPIHLTRAQWAPLDFLGGVALLLVLISTPKRAR